MEWANFFKNFAHEYGLTGFLLTLFVLDKLKVVEKYRRWKGDFAHKRKDDMPGEEHFHRRFETDLKDLEDKLNVHLEKAEREMVKIAELEKTVEFQGEQIDEYKKHTQSIFKMLSDIKTMMIEMARRSK